MIRLFISDPEVRFHEMAMIVLDSDQSHYLVGVMRKNMGDALLLFNGRDGEWLAHISRVNKKSVILVLTAKIRSQPICQGPDLFIALIKRARLETVIEKATELGVHRIQLVITRRTIGDHTNINRLQAIATEAAEQTERLDVPEVLAPQKLETLLAGSDYGCIFYGDENSTHDDFEPVPSLLEALNATEIKTGFATLIGPEGGFDDHERLMLQANSSCVAVNLGPRILRADTAAMSALTLIQAVKGDWKK